MMSNKKRKVSAQDEPESTRQKTDTVASTEEEKSDHEQISKISVIPDPNITTILKNNKFETQQTENKEKEMVEVTDDNQNVFPTRAFIQTFDHYSNPPPDYQLVIKELKNRNIPYTLYTTEEIEVLGSYLQLTRNDLVVGNFDWTRWAVQQLGITMPQPPDYPNCLKHLLHRKVWKSTLGEAKKYLLEHKDNEIFIKPTNEAKGFAAIVEPRDEMIDTLLNGIPGILIGRDATTSVWCSQVVTMIAEYRVYVVNGEIRAICQYRGEKLPHLDMKIVKKAVNILCNESDEGKTLTGCGMDFAIMEKENEKENEETKYITCLVEVNDGFSLGRYEGINGKDYTDLLIARWKQLVSYD